MKKNYFLFICCLIAVLRVVYYALAFPFFCNVDEQAHVDLVVRYSQNRVPRGIELISPETAALVSKYHSPEFFMRPIDYADGKVPVADKSDSPESLAKQKEIRTYWHKIYNHEAGSPPFYYFVAGSWLRLGLNLHLFSFDSLFCLYWMRLLNVILIFLLVFSGFKTAQLFYPGQTLLHASVALLLALIPQDTFYSVQSDSMSAVTFSICLYYFVRMLRLDSPSALDAAMCGLFLAATVLTKNSNLILFPLMFLLPLFLFFLKKKKTLSWLHISIFWIAALIPFLIWVFRNIKYFGDWSATALKSAIMGWTVWPDVSHWWENKLFTADGFNDWSKEFFASFWRGEFTWYRERISDAGSDHIYWLLTILVFILFSIAIVFRAFQKKEIATDLFLFTISSVMILFVVFLSLRYDFSDCPYPSKDRPYFTSGRLVLAMMAPFAMMVARLVTLFGAQVTLKRYLFGLLFLFLVFISFREFRVSKNALRSTYSILSIQSVDSFSQAQQSFGKGHFSDLP